MSCLLPSAAVCTCSVPVGTVRLALASLNGQARSDALAHLAHKNNSSLNSWVDLVPVPYWKQAQWMVQLSSALNDHRIIVTSNGYSTFFDKNDCDPKAITYLPTYVFASNNKTFA